MQWLTELFIAALLNRMALTAFTEILAWMFYMNRKDV